MLKINNDLSLAVEAENKKLRLIIFSNGEELVCHKTTTGQLTNFFNSDADQLFKGRLQLLKNNDTILVKVKGNIEGMIRGEELNKMIGVE
ncbi:MAG: hypothetical protein ACTHNW_03895 [Mucilaginibacter sp.]